MWNPKGAGLQDNHAQYYICYTATLPHVGCDKTTSVLSGQEQVWIQSLTFTKPMLNNSELPSYLPIAGRRTDVRMIFISV